MITPEDIMRDRDVAKIAGYGLWAFQRQCVRGFKAGELDFLAADPVTSGRSRLWLRKDVERVIRDRVRVPHGEREAVRQ